MQLWSLAAAATRHLVWGLPSAARQMHIWRARAQAAIDTPIRQDALDVFARKRTHVDGAGLFWTLLRRRTPALLRLLIAYQSMVDFLDYASERGVKSSRDGGAHIHTALIDAIEPRTTLSDHYRHHPWHEDAGYLRALVLACRLWASELPTFPRVRPLALREAERGPEVLDANHSVDPQVRDERLRIWAARHFPAERRLLWFEISASTSGALANHALLALAADAEATSGSIADTYAAYMPWVALSTAMLDSYADLAEDLSSGGHSYVSHYDSLEVARRRIRQIVAETMRSVLSLPEGRRHAVIVACMVAMYLTKDSVRAPQARAQTDAIAAAAGPLVVALLPVLRAWRVLNSHGGA